MWLIYGRPGRLSNLGDVGAVDASEPEPDQGGGDLPVRVEGPVHDADRLCVDIARRVVLATALVLKRHRAAQEHEVDDSIVDMPRRRLTGVELG